MFGAVIGGYLMEHGNIKVLLQPTELLIIGGAGLGTLLANPLLLNSSKQVQEAVGGYFKDPSGTSKQVGSDRHGSGENVQLRKEDMAKLKEELARKIHKLANFDKLNKQMKMMVTNEGLRIELLEALGGTFFDSGNATPTETGRSLLSALAQEIG